MIFMDPLLIIKVLRPSFCCSNWTKLDIKWTQTFFTPYSTLQKPISNLKLLKFPQNKINLFDTFFVQLKPSLETLLSSYFLPWKLLRTLWEPLIQQNIFREFFLGRMSLEMRSYSLNNLDHSQENSFWVNKRDNVIVCLSPN